MREIELNVGIKYFCVNCGNLWHALSAFWANKRIRLKTNVHKDNERMSFLQTWCEVWLDETLSINSQKCKNNMFARISAVLTNNCRCLTALLPRKFMWRIFGVTQLKSVSILNFRQHCILRWKYVPAATLFGEKCVRLYLLGYLSISVFTTQNFRIKEKNENLF
jgi:hypothetical protein